MQSLYTQQTYNLLVKKIRKELIIFIILFVVAIGLGIIPCFYVTQDSIGIFTIFSLIPIILFGFPAVYLLFSFIFNKKELRFVLKMLNYEKQSYIGTIIDKGKKILLQQNVNVIPYTLKVSKKEEYIFYCPISTNILFNINDVVKVELVDNILAGYEVMNND